MRRLASILALGLLALTACTPSPPARSGIVEEPRIPVLYVDPVVEYADIRLRHMVVRQKVASILMMHTGGTAPDQLAAFVRTFELGGVILMGDNMPNPVTNLAGVTATLSEDAGLPVLIAIDQEGGTVRRVMTDAGASAGVLRGLPPTAARDTFSARAGLLASLGVNVNFGIVADVTADTRSFIYPRVLGTTAGASSERVAEAVAGEHDTVMSTLKHFPGHGVAPGNSHFGIPSTGMGYAEWLGSHAPPFQAGIAQGAEFVMMGHLRFPAVDPQPATLSARWHEILRDDLGFRGVIITDDLAMLQASGEPAYADPLANAIAAINAGTTMVLFVGGVDPGSLIAGLVAAVDDGRLSLEKVDAAAHRLLVLRRQLSGETGPYWPCYEDCGIPLVE